MRDFTGLKMNLPKIITVLLGAAFLLTPARAQTLIEKRFDVPKESEALVELIATAPETSWVEKGREAATATIYLDNRYHQDLILFAGGESFGYRLSLGRVAPGEHTLRVEFNRKQSAAQASTIEISRAGISLIERGSPEFELVAHAPVLYARPNTIGHFSDIPLLMYCETENKGETKILRYTVIFSNEDGGTQTSALMSRWGRTTDIEWVIETHLDPGGRVVKSIYQGVKHETKVFRGKREADHPLLIVGSDNNNFADKKRSEVRFALSPVAVDLNSSSREEIMDRHPWTYRVMAEEMIREGKIVTERSLGPRIADLRSYLYLDANSEQQNGGVISFAVKLKGDPLWYSSNLGIGSYRIDRSGYFRTTIQLPPGTTIDRIERLSARCELTGNPRSSEEISKAVKAQCNLKSVNKVFMLNRNFQPGESLPFKIDPITLPYGVIMEIEKK